MISSHRIGKVVHSQSNMVIFSTTSIVCYYFSSKCYHVILPDASCPHHHRTVRYQWREPKPRTRIWPQYNRLDQIRNMIMNYSIPIKSGGERCLNHIIHQFLTHAHWIILSLLLLLSTIMLNNIFFLFYISYYCDTMCASLHPVYTSVFSHSPTYTDS